VNVKNGIWIVVFAMLALVRSSARAEEPLSFDLRPHYPPVQLSTEGSDPRWFFELLGTGAADVTDRHVGMGGVAVGVGYQIFTWLAIDFDTTVSGVAVQNSDGAAINATIGLRHTIAKIDKATIFIDIAGGVIEASSELPYGGTHLNNTIDFGPGVYFPLKDNMSLMVGVRYFHVSNAQSEGPDRNPSVNAIKGLVGLVWRF
jgi:Lipid A 3-O-deacylase (PagL)